MSENRTPKPESLENCNATPGSTTPSEAGTSLSSPGYEMTCLARYFEMIRKPFGEVDWEERMVTFQEAHRILDESLAELKAVMEKEGIPLVPYSREDEEYAGWLEE